MKKSPRIYMLLVPMTPFNTIIVGLVFVVMLTGLLHIGAAIWRLFQ
jgi:hypothetical protein